MILSYVVHGLLHGLLPPYLSKCTLYFLMMLKGLLFAWVSFFRLRNTIWTSHFVPCISVFLYINESNKADKLKLKLKLSARLFARTGKLAQFSLYLL